MQVKITSYSGFVHFYPFLGKLPQTFNRLLQSMDNIGSEWHYPKDAFWKLRPSHGGRDKRNRPPKLGSCFPPKTFPSHGNCPVLLITVSKELLVSMSSLLSETNNPKWVPFRTMWKFSPCSMWVNLKKPTTGGWKPQRSDLDPKQEDQNPVLILSDQTHLVLLRYY